MFRQSQPRDAQGYIDSAVRLADLREGELTRVRLQDQRILLTLLESLPVAFGEFCPHGAASLSQGHVRGCLVCCPDHGYCFDMGNGRIAWPVDESYRLRRYATKVEDGRVRICLDPV